MATASKLPDDHNVEEKRRLVAQLLASEDDSALHPLTPAQTRLWFLEQIDGVSSEFNLSAAIALSGRVDRQALGRAFKAVIARHESLRTVFAMVGGNPMQQFLLVSDTAANFVDLRSLPPDSREASVAEMIREAARKPFDIYQGPVIRLTLYELDQDRHILLVCAHHIVIDGVSLGILVQELGALYEAELTGRHVALPDLPIEYGD